MLLATLIVEPAVTSIDATLPGIITAVAVLVTSISGLVLAIRTSREVRTVHAIVNSRSDDQIRRVDQLGQALQQAGILVPARPGYSYNDPGHRVSNPGIGGPKPPQRRAGDHLPEFALPIEHAPTPPAVPSAAPQPAAPEPAHPRGHPIPAVPRSPDEPLKPGDEITITGQIDTPPS